MDCKGSDTLGNNVVGMVMGSKLGVDTTGTFQRLTLIFLGIKILLREI